MERHLDTESPSPRLASLATFVAGVLAVTGVCVASFLAEDPAHHPRAPRLEGCPAQCAETLRAPARGGWTALEAASEAPCGRPS